MATIYAAICKDCRHEFEFYSGPLMSGGRKACDTCGDSVTVPSLAPAGSFELSKQGLKEYLRSGAFDTCGREFTYYENANLEDLTRGCTCGGKMIWDDGQGSVKPRCPECKSANLDVEMCGFAD